LFLISQLNISCFLFVRFCLMPMNVALSSLLLKCRLQARAWWLRLTRQDYQYPIGPFVLALPPEHALPRYQAQYPCYDQFLTVLATVLPSGSRVIDVGANCGDSVAALLSGNTALDIVAIEADPLFSRYLIANLALLQQQCPAASLRSCQALVGLQVQQAVLSGGAGTRKALPVAGGQLQTASLDQLQSQWPDQPLSLLKIDVDGFDYDVLDSATALLAREQPLLFFEYQCDNSQQQQGYQQSLQRLAQQGYQYWLLFDNFGHILLQTDQVAHIIQLQAYLQAQGPLTRGPVVYFDVLTATAAQYPLLQQAVHSYQQRCAAFAAAAG
jgi:FkbM family methyltransferase